MNSSAISYAGQTGTDIEPPLRLHVPYDEGTLALDPSADNADELFEARQRVEQLERQLQLVRQELEARRRRDDALNFYMTRFDEEQRLAAKLQRDFLPKILPQVGPVHFNILFRPAGYVSGDFYDVMRLDEEHVGFFIADAVGHGMPAALLSMYIKRALVTKDVTDNNYRLLSPGESLERLNQALVDQQLSHATFATALYGYINVNTLEMRFARGGHPSPLLMDHNGELRQIEADGPLLGIFGSETFEEAVVTLNPGDKLVLFTDGVEVAFTENNVVDQDKWLREFERRKAMRGDDLLHDLTQYLDSESGSLEPKDDLTILMMDIRQP